MQENQELPSRMRPHCKASETETREFWKKRTGVDLTEDETRDALQNMSAFLALVSEWSVMPVPAHGQNEQEG